MKKIISIIGTRPQFIKIAAMSNIFLKLKKKINHKIINTSQHYDYDMSGIFIKDLKIPKIHYNLKIKNKNQLNTISKIIIKLEKILTKEKPEIVIVYGDTNSTLASAIVASKLKIKLAHVEAGLRSNDVTMQEEINRKIVDNLSDYLFAPTEIAKKNLIREGLKNKIYLSGDIMFDIFKKQKHRFNNKNILNLYKLKPKDYLLITLHREANLENKFFFQEIFKFLNFIKSNFKIIFVAHPRTQKKIKSNKIIKKEYLKDIKVIKPLSYSNIQTLIKYSKYVITDSGGLQKEAFFHNVPCLVIRQNTEWAELVKYRKSFLVKKIKKNELLKSLKKLNFANKKKYSFYGNGNSSLKIIKTLLK